MSVMVLLASKDGSKVVTVACPKCGRISRQILKDGYESSPIAEFRSSHTCPVCGTTFASSSSTESAKFSGSYARYISQGEQSYNADIKTAYDTIDNRTAEKIMICSIKLFGSERNRIYISNDMTIKANDKVIVPLGFNNAEKTGIVISAELYSRDKVPYPIEETKAIIRKAPSAESQQIQQISAPPKMSNGSDVQLTANTKVAKDTVPPSQHSIERQTIQDAVAIPKTAPVPDSGHSNKAVLKRKVEHWKKQLLDLSKRNKMINYRETKRATLKILEPEFTELFNRLAVLEEELTFQRPIDKDSDLRTFSMLSLLETLSYPIPVHVGDIKAEGSLLERRIALNNLRSKSKLARDEQGTNILYLSFGFIEWRENNSANAQWLKSPVLMMPVSLKLESIQAPYTLLRYDDDIEVNPTLDYLFNERYGIDLPMFELNGEESVEQYMQTIEEIADQHGWKFIREVSLGLLSFLKISMYHDLNNNYERMFKNPVIRAITGDANAANNIPSELTELDFDRVSPNECYQVVNSDSSQQEAILLSKAGVSFVMQGPPGTGKSQTITNIIAEALADGKTILFVSEKAAALQVVYKRLTEVGLDDFCLALHSHKANKKEILDSIFANLKLPRKRMKDSVMFELTELFQDRQALNQYVNELHEEILPLEKSLYDVFGELSCLQDVPYIQFYIEFPALISSTTFNTMLYRVENYAKTLQHLGVKLSENPWNGTIVKMVTQRFKDDLAQNSDGLAEFLLVLDEFFSEVITSFSLNESCTWAGAKRTIVLFDVIEKTPLFPYKLAKSTERAVILDKSKMRQQEKKEYLNALNNVLLHFNESVFAESLSIWLDDVHQAVAQIKSIDKQLQIMDNEILGKADSLQTFSSGVVCQLNAIGAAYDKGIALIPVALTDSPHDIDFLAEILHTIANSPQVIRGWFVDGGTQNAQLALPTAKMHTCALNEAKTQIASKWDNSAILNSVRKHKQVAHRIVEELHSILDAFARSIEVFPLVDSSTASFDATTTMFKCATELLNSQKVIRQWFVETTFDQAKQLLPLASAHATRLNSMEAWLTQQLWDSKALDIDAEAMLYRFKTEYTSFFKIFKSSYRTDIKTIRGVSKKVGVKFSIGEITELLQTVVDINAEKKWFVENQMALAESFGELFIGEKSNWEAIGKGLSYADGVRALFTQGIVPEKVIEIICDKQLHANDLSELAKLLPTLSESNTNIAKERITTIIENCRGDIRESLLPQFIRMEEVCNELIEMLTIQNQLSLFDLGLLDVLITNLTEANKLGITFDGIDIRLILNILIKLCEEEKWLAANQSMLAINFDHLYSGESTDWNAINEGILFAEQIRSAFGQTSLPESVVGMLCDKVAHEKDYFELSNVSSVLNKETLEVVYTDISKVILDYSGQGIKEQLLPSFTLLHEQSSKLISLIAEMSAHAVQEIPNSSLIEKVSEARKVHETRIALEKTYSDHKEFFGSRIAGLKTDWDSIISDLESVSALFAMDESSQMTESFISQFCENADVRAKISAAKADLQYRIAGCENDYTAFKNLFESSADFDNVKISVVADRVLDCLDNIMILDNWISCVETRNSCNELGLNDFTEKVEQHDNILENVVGIFKRGFLTLWVQSVIGSKKMVEQFRRHSHDEKIRRFVSLDERQLLIAQERIRQNVISRIPDTNRVLSANDELSILQREIGKKRRIMPLRKLFKSIPNLMLKLKPCMMMSPLSVAYFLEAESYEFDMVIFDEASQIFPQDAVGSIFRGKQVIIAGDSKQLPPTNFFATSTSNDDDDFDEEDDEAVGTEIYDSILEETTSVLPNQTLLWHYRSKHENLIAFSNQEIYKNELVTFPSSVNNGADTGVEFIFVENGVYEGKGRNTAEARRCVELVRQHIDKMPNRSLGIIAFSESQQKTIALEIQKFREQHPEYESFFTEDKEDEFFVKNLENVQGDERDTIIFSVSYAKTKEQRDNNRSMALRFGPLGQKGGERRLNVAITRAKCNVKLVSSILPSDIDLSRTESEGIKMLRQYIEFAMNGSSSLRTGQSESEKDVFLDVVAEFLISHGYRIKKYVGCSGYKIDIAILHPNNDDCFVAGIECDGLSYAAAKNARDRDHLRKSVLEAMGWQIYRVWSPEWIARQDIEGQKLLTFINTAIKEYKEVKKAEVPEQTSTQTQTESFAEVINEGSATDTSLLITSIDTDPSNPYGFAEYTEAVWHETPRIMQYFGDDRVAEEIKYIVGIEQPIYIDLLYQRMAGAFGNQKATAPVRNAVERVLKGSKLKSLVVKDKDGFVTLTGFQDLKARIPADGYSPRQINFISLDEIGIAMLTIAEQAIGLTSDGLLDATAKALGYARKGERMMTCMNGALERLIKRGRVKLVDGKVRVIGGDDRG